MSLSIKGILIVNDALTPTKCLLRMGVGVEGACKASEII